MLSFVRKKLSVWGRVGKKESYQAGKAHGKVQGVGGFLDPPWRTGDAQGTGHGAMSGYLSNTCFP